MTRKIKKPVINVKLKRSGRQEQTKSILVAPGSKTMNEGLHDGADVLDERETQRRRSLIGTALKDGQDRPETQNSTEESAIFMSDPTRAVKCMLKRLCKRYSEASVHSWSFPHQEMQCEVRVVKGTYWEGELEGLSTTGAWICFGGYLLETYSSIQQIVALSTTENKYISTKDVAHAPEIRSDLAECDMTQRMKGKTERWSHGIWIGEAAMTDECMILTENGVQKAKSLHRVTPKEKFLISELEKAREFPWNYVAENLKSATETRQDQDSCGHRRMCLTIEIVLRIGATPQRLCRIEISHGSMSGAIAKNTG